MSHTLAPHRIAALAGAVVLALCATARSDEGATIDKINATFILQFTGDVKAAAAQAARKAGPEGSKEYQDALLRAERETGERSMRGTGTALTFMETGRMVHFVKYEVTKEEPARVTLKLGRDRITTKDVNLELVINIVDDNTISFRDPFAAEAAKAPTLVYRKRGS